MTAINQKKSQTCLETSQRTEITSTTEPSQIPGNQVILCAKNEHYIYFEPTCQLLTFFVGENPISKVELSFSSSRLLELLIIRADTIVAREDILAYAWPGRVVTQSSLNQAISSIREQLGDEMAKEIIQTMPRRGYQFNSRFLISVEEWPALKHDVHLTPTITASSPHTANLSPNIFIQHHRTLLIILIALLLSAFAYRFSCTLLLKPDLSISTEYIGDKNLIYTASTPKQLTALKAEIQQLQDKLLSHANTPTTLLFNRMHNFFDIICINSQGEVFSILVHQSQLSKITDQQLVTCAK